MRLIEIHSQTMAKKIQKQASVKETVTAEYKTISLGLMVLILAAIGLSFLTLKAKNHFFKSIPSFAFAAIQTHKTIIKPAITPTPTVIAKPQSKDITYTIQANDSLAKIGKTFCNDDKVYLRLAEINNLNQNSTLNPGDVIKISCESNVCTK